jgi:hypothetical protein
MTGQKKTFDRCFREPKAITRKIFRSLAKAVPAAFYQRPRLLIRIREAVESSSHLIKSLKFKSQFAKYLG